MFVSPGDTAYRRDIPVLFALGMAAPIEGPWTP